MGFPHETHDGNNRAAPKGHVEAREYSLLGCVVQVFSQLGAP